MNQNVRKEISLELPRLPAMMGGLSKANHYLKVMSFVLLLITILALAISLIQMSKTITVIALSESGDSIERGRFPKVEDEIKASIKAYLDRRYYWSDQTVRQRLLEAENFVEPKLLTSFRNSTANVMKFSIEKKVSQRLLPEKIEVDMAKKTVLITGDRITAIAGMRAIGPLKLELTFGEGPRTPLNPWGLYITKEREE